MVWDGSSANQGLTALQASREKICPEHIKQFNRDSMAGKESEKMTRDWAPACRATDNPTCRENCSASGEVRLPAADVIRRTLLPPEYTRVAMVA
jgi:hypothetical protein